MLLRSLVLSAVLILVVPPTTQAFAPDTDSPPALGWVTMTGVGLPVFADGRVRNHVFVEMKLHLKAGYAPEQARAKDAVMRDALIRLAHRQSFGEARNWNRVDERALAAAVLGIANTHLGQGRVLRVEIVRQTPRMRVRNPV